VLAGFAYARGELDVPNEAVSPDEVEQPGNVNDVIPPLGLPSPF
jgi:hypothetical protein